MMGRGKARAKLCRVESNVLIFPPQCSWKLLNGILSKRITQSDLHLKNMRLSKIGKIIRWGEKWKREDQ